MICKHGRHQQANEIFDPGKSCTVCGIVENLKRCGKCLSTWYCGRDHQVQDWKNHKTLCKELQKISIVSDGTKISPTHNARTTNNTVGNDDVTSRNASQNDNESGTGTGNKVDGASTTNGKPTGDGKKSKKNRKKSKKGKTGVESQKNETNETQTDQTLNNQGKVTDSGTRESSESLTDGSVSDKQDNRGSQVKRKQSETNYDPRPFRRCAFPAPQDRNLNSLANHIAEQLRQSSRCIIDDLLPANAARTIRAEVEKLHASGSFVDGPLSGGKASSDTSKKYSKKAIRSDKITWLQGNEVEYPNLCNYMKHLDRVVQVLNGYLQKEYIISGRTKAMVACYPGNGTGYAYHVDNPNKDGRVLTFLYYLNEGWDAEKLGGNLRILPPDGDYIDIEPILNRLLVFWSDRRNPHEVQPAWDQRYAITMWYFDKEEREAAKAAQLNEDVSNLPNDMNRVDVRSKTTDKATVQQEIKKQSQDAIGSLSEEELEALALLVESSPDPREALTGLKVAPQIQDALLRQLEERKTSQTTTVGASATAAT